ncbi:hypothetical protein ABMA28_003881 [Loxostege sticticalis]|uniref:Mediator of DNA damage checkpoint protein 1 n=1 Tax=Loxostege sticticalis TaxID=481309 RepID=A0ABD0STD5_LOXSC
MECTQRLECTQEYEARTERICPEQIGFLGICGVKHPVKRGPNKIGRDPQTCSIVLNLNSISRQHAVINVLNKTEYMLMDLDSANKTKLMDKTLPPYIPYPLKDGDMVQFGDVFGVFRLLEEDTDLPMTQAIDMPETQIPETPVSNRHVSRMNNIPISTIPESPDVSDKDESFIVPSQPKRDKCYRNSNSHFVKPSAKVISIQPLGTNKIDNVYWNSSKKSVSLNSQFNDSDSSLNDSTLPDKKSARQSNDKSIYEMETQAPAPIEADESTDSIYTANTQVPPTLHTSSLRSLSTHDPNSIHDANTQAITSFHNADTQVDASTHTASPKAPASIHTENTQAPIISSPSIHSLNTQLPPSTNLPEVCKIDNQQEMQFDLYTLNKKQNNNDIFEAETQLCTVQDEKLNKICDKSEDTKVETAKNLNVSAEEILFEEMDCQEFGYESQALLPQENLLDLKEDLTDRKPKNVTIKKLPTISKTKNEVIIHSDSSTDCEDIDMLPTQKITGKQGDDEDSTDCEDLFDEVPKKPTKDLKKSAEGTKEENYEDMLTQVITEDDINTSLPNLSISKTTCNVNFEDMPTQIIVADEDVIIAEKPIQNLPTQVISGRPALNNVSEDLVSPFKIPLMSPLKAKRKDIKVDTPKSKPTPKKVSPIVIPDDDNYYAATQDILDDLCTQPDIQPNNLNKDNAGPSNNSDDDFLPSSAEDYRVGNKFPHLENNLSPRKKALNKSFDSSDGDDNVNNFIGKLSSQQIRDVIGVELTPKKVRPIKFMDIDLPNSQEIKTSVSMNIKTPVTESSSESEAENDSEECTPILFRKKKKPKVDAKMDLTKVFAAEALCRQNANNRVITRLTNNKLKPKFLTEQGDEIDKEIITENISRLKSKSEKSKNKEASKDSRQETQIADKVKDESKLDEKENAYKLEKEDSKMDITKYFKTDVNCAKADKVTKKDDDTKTIKTTSVKHKPKEKSKNNKKLEKEAKKESNRKSKNEEIITIDKDESKEVSPNDTKDSHITNVSIETSIDSKPTRSTRNRRKVNQIKEKCSDSVKEDSQSEKKSKSSREPIVTKTIEIDLTEEVVEIRRSRRQPKATKKKIESDDKIVKRETKSVEKADSIPKPAARRGRPPKNARIAKAEQSTVYSLSSESGTDSPKSILKRSAPENLDPPSPKRTRSAVNAKNNMSLRATSSRMNKIQHVLFTAFPCEEVKAKLEKLGAVVVTDVSACSVVLTLAVKRTFKLLCAVGLGRPVVGPAWVQACVDTNTLVDPWSYILKDEDAEKRFQFSLEKTLLGKRNFLSGFHVSSTPSVVPTTAEMKLIVECSGGTWKEEGPQWICVSCSADKHLWPALKQKGAVVVSKEFILGGVLRQRAEITGNKL